MQATITLPPDLAQRIAGFAAIHGKNLQEVAVETLTMIFEPSEEVEHARTFQALESARNGEGQLAQEVLSEIARESAWLDVEYMVACCKEADASVSLETVRQILAKTSGSLADDIIAERDERF